MMLVSCGAIQGGAAGQPVRTSHATGELYLSNMIILSLVLVLCHLLVLCNSCCAVLPPTVHNTNSTLQHGEMKVRENATQHLGGYPRQKSSGSGFKFSTKNNVLSLESGLLELYHVQHRKTMFIYSTLTWNQDNCLHDYEILCEHGQ